MIKIAAIVIAYVAVYCTSASLFNAGHIYPSFGLVLASIGLPAYLYFKKKGHKIES